MPQLNPAPWLKTFIITWLFLLIIIHPMLMKFHPFNPPQQPHKTYKTTPWNWPWQ